MVGMIFLNTCVLPLLKPVLHRTFLEEGFSSHRECPWPGLQPLGEAQETSSQALCSEQRVEVETSQGRGNRVVLYIAPVSSGNLRAWPPAGLTTLPPVTGRLTWKASPSLSPLHQALAAQSLLQECQDPTRATVVSPHTF